MRWGTDAPGYTVVKTWYQDDFGLLGRFDELFSIGLAGHPRVGRVIHLTPPVAAGELRHRGRHGRWDANVERLLGRATGDGAVLDGGVHCYTPPVDPSDLDIAVDRAVGVVRRHTAPGTRLAVVATVGADPFPGMVADALPDALHITQIEDDHRAFVAPARVAELDATYRRHAARASLVLCSSAVLAAEFSAVNPSCFVTPRVTEPARFAAAAAAAELVDLRRPLVIYTGWLRSRIDWPLVREVVATLQEMMFVFVGTGAEVADEELTGLDNWVALGTRPYEHLPNLLAAADVAVVPHEISAVTEGMTPEKVVHYLAAGLPVVGTPVAGLRELGRPLVHVAADADRFVVGIRTALSEDDEGQRTARRAAVERLTPLTLADWFVAALDRAGAGTLPSPPDNLALPAAGHLVAEAGG